MKLCLGAAGSVSSLCVSGCFVEICPLKAAALVFSSWNNVTRVETGVFRTGAGLIPAHLNPGLSMI